MCSMQGRRKISHHSPSNIILLYLALKAIISTINILSRLYF